MPAAVLSRYGNSIGYICGVYHVGFPNQPPDIRTRFSGTGFLVADGLIATNRHLAEPWVGDSKAENLIRRGARPSLESALVFFPGLPRPAKLSHRFVSETSDLALLRAENSEAIHALPVLPLAKSPAATGQFVTVIGYPLGIAGMIAKSPPNLNKHLASRPHPMNAPNELAALSLIRPSITFGHVGDIIADKLIYDAPTAHGGSGGPVVNSQGEVVAINTAYMHGFSGANIGISVKSLYQLLGEVRGVSTAKAIGGRVITQESGTPVSMDTPETSTRRSK